MDLDSLPNITKSLPLKKRKKRKRKKQDLGCPISSIRQQSGTREPRAVAGTVPTGAAASPRYCHHHPGQGAANAG